MLTQCRISLAALGAIAALGSAYSARATQIAVIATSFAGEDTSVRISLDDAGGDIAVRLTVNEGVADLRGFFINIQDFSLFAGLTVTGDDVTGFKVKNNGVKNLKHGVNLNGRGSPCPCDLGVALGTPGIGKDDIFSTTFVLDAQADLVLDDFAGELIGIRVTSVGVGDSNDSEKDFHERFDKFKKDFKDDDDDDDEDGRNGSAKLVARIPDPIPEPSTAALVVLGLAALRYAGRRH